jgi:hypothetical protein
VIPSFCSARVTLSVEPRGRSNAFHVVAASTVSSKISPAPHEGISQGDVALAVHMFSSGFQEIPASTARQWNDTSRQQKTYGRSS